MSQSEQLKDKYTEEEIQEVTSSAINNLKSTIDKTPITKNQRVQIEEYLKKLRLDALNHRATLFHIHNMDKIIKALEHIPMTKQQQNNLDYAIEKAKDIIIFHSDN